MGIGKRMRVKLSEERRQMSMKFPVTPESMSAVVLTVLFSPCSEMGKLIDLLLGSATSTRLIKWEEDIEVTSLVKNPLLQEWRFPQFPQWVL